MCPSTQDLKAKAEWDGAAGDSRYHLLSELSSELNWYESFVIIANHY